MKIRNILLLFALVSVFACKPELDDFTTTNGDADFTKYVAIGNSLTAGYTDGDLFKSGQENSYPSMLAYQMEAAGGGEFKQPLMLDEFGFGKRLLLDVSRPGPVPAGGTPNPENYNPIGDQGPFNNMGVPGAKCFHLIAPNYGIDPENGNPYFYRFASNPSATVLDDAAAQQATFFSCWIGNNDVLTYALSGGTKDAVTDIATFEGAMDLILGTMTANEAKGVVANIPDISNIPYFSAIPFNGLELRQGQADTLNGAYYQIGNAIGYTYPFTFVKGFNPFLVSDADSPLPSPFNVRQIQQGETILLPALPYIQLAGMGTLDLSGDNAMPYGIPDSLYLSSIEMSDIQNAIIGYNTKLEFFKDKYDLALMDAHEIFLDFAADGFEYEGIIYTNDFLQIPEDDPDRDKKVTAFSSDGVHMTAQGYALVANFFIDAINDKYKAQLKPVNPNLYPGLYYFQ